MAFPMFILSKCVLLTEIAMTKVRYISINSLAVARIFSSLRKIRSASQAEPEGVTMKGHCFLQFVFSYNFLNPRYTCLAVVSLQIASST